MQTKFEYFAASSMLCDKDAPPRQNGNFRFDRQWESRAFGVALSLSKSGYFEWEDFRQNLISAINDWEAENPNTSKGWDYYECWLLALERVTLQTGLINSEELAKKINMTSPSQTKVTRNK